MGKTDDQACGNEIRMGDPGDSRVQATKMNWDSLSTMLWATPLPAPRCAPLWPPEG